MKNPFHYAGEPFFIGCDAGEGESKSVNQIIKNRTIMKTYEIKSNIDNVLSTMGFSPMEITDILLAGKEGKLKLCVAGGGSHIIVDTITKDFPILNNQKDKEVIEETLSDIQDLIISGDLILIE